MSDEEKIAYLAALLENLVNNINEDVPRSYGTRHLWDAVDDAEAALGLKG